jgi:hypothetical protein
MIEKDRDRYVLIGSIHGLRYLANRGICQRFGSILSSLKICKISNVSKNFFRVFWFLAIVIATVCLLFSLSKVLTNDDTKIKLPIYKVPFPAITICPETKTRKSIMDIAEAYRNVQANNTAHYNKSE